MTVAEYVADFLADHGIDTCFSICGGGSIFLNDAVGHHPKIRTVYMHHEQACAMAAEGYARITNKPALVLVTTGPGGLNALTGVWGAYVDSIPMIVISGQVKTATCMGFNDCSGLRQLGDQEVDIVGTVRGGQIVKHARMVQGSRDIRVALEHALELATSGRPGPCWIDIPIDVQAAKIDPAELPHKVTEVFHHWDRGRMKLQVAEVVRRLRESKRPVILAGSGVRLAGAVELLRNTVRYLGIPVTTAWTAHDLIPTDHPCCAGRPGTVGDRAGNFVVQSSDLLLVLGSRLNLRQVSYNWENFAPGAYKIQVDIDGAEMRKPTVRPDLPIVADVREFLHELLLMFSDAEGVVTPAKLSKCKTDHSAWLAWCRERVAANPVVTAKMREQPPYEPVFSSIHDPAIEKMVVKSGPITQAQADHLRTTTPPPKRPPPPAINPYVFVEALFDCLEDDDVVVCGDGTACVVPFQCGKIKAHTRMWTNSGCAAMGYDLPAAIGAVIARRGKRVICLAGDGSIMLNLQELQTISHHKLPIKIFVLNNDGYLSIRQTQDNFFGRRTGEGPTSGLGFPLFGDVAGAFNIDTRFISVQHRMKFEIDQALKDDKTCLIDVRLDPAQPFEPKISTRRNEDGTLTSATLEDMAPFLSAEERERNMWRDGR